jgi:hypothetical protein
MHTQSIDQKTKSIPLTFYITSSKAVESICGDMRTVTFESKKPLMGFSAAQPFSQPLN